MIVDATDALPERHILHFGREQIRVVTLALELANYASGYLARPCPFEQLVVRAAFASGVVAVAVIYQYLHRCFLSCGYIVLPI